MPPPTPVLSATRGRARATRAASRRAAALLASAWRGVTDQDANRDGKARPRRVKVLPYAGLTCTVSAGNQLVHLLEEKQLVSVRDWGCVWEDVSSPRPGFSSSGLKERRAELGRADPTSPCSNVTTEAL